LDIPSPDHSEQELFEDSSVDSSPITISQEIKDPSCREFPNKEENAKKISYSREELMEKWLYTIRVTTYNFLEELSNQQPDPRKMFCTFSSDCKKVIKGRGNLRRHIEWHLKRIEDACHKQKELLFAETERK